MSLRKRYREWFNELRGRKSTFVLYCVLRAMVLVTLVLQLLNRNYESVFLCLLTLVLFLMPSFLARRLELRLPDALENLILIFIFAAEILGEIGGFYTRFPIWDTLLHTTNGFLAAGIGFCLVDMLNRHERFSLQLSALYLSIVAFCFSMTIGVLWEFFEYGMDVFFGLDMQKDTVLHSIASVTLDPTHTQTPVSIRNITQVAVNGTVLPVDGYLDIGLSDTMADLIVNFIGAVIFSVLGGFYVRHRSNGSIVTQLVPRTANDSANRLPQRLTLRPMLAEDYHALKQSVEPAFAEHSHLDVCLQTDSVAYVATLSDRPVGFAAMVRAEKETRAPQLTALGVLPQAQGMGVGSLLMDRIESDAADHGRRILAVIGLDASYGVAQRMLMRRGYCMDGSGAWYDGEPLQAGDRCLAGAQLVCRMIKPLE